MATDTVSVHFSDSARDYLADLLAKQETEGIGIRMFVSNPGTPNAETCIAYCRPGEENEDDLQVDLGAFIAHLEKRSLPYLEEAKVDYNKDQMGGQLTIRAPNAKMPKVTDDSPLEDKINYILYNEVNPSLAAHGGMVSLVEITDAQEAILRFGGGCQGCGMVDVTLKQGVEKALLDQLPELKAVRDVTDHSDRSQAYY